MARRRLPIWKQYYFTSPWEQGQLSAAWQSSCAAFGADKRVIEDGEFVNTNLSIRDIKALARHAGVRLPDCVHMPDDDEYLQDLLKGR